jgi:hypothetical protein
MAYTSAAKKAMLNHVGSLITHVGAFDADAAITGTTGEADDNTFTKTTHGLSNGNLVLLSALTGGAGLVTGRPYFVIGSTASTFQLSTSVGGSAVDFTTDATAVTVTRLVEISGGSPAYARKAIAFNAAVDPGTMDDSTNGAVIDIPAGATVDYIGGFSALTAGTLYDVVSVVSESFAGQGTYTVTDYDLDLLAGV